jgi:hypothetical protein
MYGKLTAPSVVGAAALPVTGFNVLAMVVAAVTLIILGISLLKLVPKGYRGKHRYNARRAERSDATLGR